jgi:hypothetical protein
MSCSCKEILTELESGSHAYHRPHNLTTWDCPADIAGAVWKVIWRDGRMIVELKGPVARGAEDGGTLERLDGAAAPDASFRCWVAGRRPAENVGHLL